MKPRSFSRAARASLSSPLAAETALSASATSAEREALGSSSALAGAAAATTFSSSESCLLASSAFTSPIVAGCCSRPLETLTALEEERERDREHRKGAREREGEREDFSDCRKPRLGEPRVKILRAKKKSSPFFQRFLFSLFSLLLSLSLSLSPPPWPTETAAPVLL